MTSQNWWEGMLDATTSRFNWIEQSLQPLLDEYFSFYLNTPKNGELTTISLDWNIIPTEQHNHVKSKQLVPSKADYM